MSSEALSSTIAESRLIPPSLLPVLRQRQGLSLERFRYSFSSTASLIALFLRDDFETSVGEATLERILPGSHVPYARKGGIQDTSSLGKIGPP